MLSGFEGWTLTAATATNTQTTQKGKGNPTSTPGLTGAGIRTPIRPAILRQTPSKTYSGSSAQNATSNLQAIFNNRLESRQVSRMRYDRLPAFGRSIHFDSQA